MICKQETKQLQGVAILAMLCLHLFCTYTPLFTPLVYIGSIPLTYFIGQASDCCVMIYCFCSGYGLMASYIACNEKGRQYFVERRKGLFRLLQSYWIILLMFAVVTLLLGEEWLKSPIVFIANFLVFGSSYNGAWWFVGTYILMVLLSPIIFKMVQRHPVMVAIIAPIVYTTSYVARFRLTGFLEQQLSLLGMSYAELLLGVYFYKYSFMKRIEEIWNRILPNKYQLPVLFFIIVATIFVRGYVTTLFIAPLSGIVFIFCYLLLARKLLTLRKVFSFLGKHSTNIWLTHMFFYMPAYGGVAYYGKYPLFVLGILLGICLALSCGIFKVQTKIKF